MSASSDQDFQDLKRLLALKRHEQPQAELGNPVRVGASLFKFSLDTIINPHNPSSVHNHRKEERSSHLSKRINGLPVQLGAGFYGDHHD